MESSLYRKLESIISRISLAVITGSAFSFLPQLTAYASDPPKTGGIGSLDPKTIISEAETNSALEPVATTVQGAGASIYKIVFFAFVFISLCGIVWSGIKIITSNAQTRQEAKGDVMWKFVGALIGFTAIGVITLLFGVGSGLFSGK